MKRVKEINFVKEIYSEKFFKDVAKEIRRQEGKGLEVQVDCSSLYMKDTGDIKYSAVIVGYEKIKRRDKYERLNKSIREF